MCFIRCLPFCMVSLEVFIAGDHNQHIVSSVLQQIQVISVCHTHITAMHDVNAFALKLMHCFFGDMHIRKELYHAFSPPPPSRHIEKS